MWNHQPDLPTAIELDAMNPRLAKKIANGLHALPDKGAVAGFYLKQRRMAEEDIGDMLTEIAAEELTHEDMLLEILRKLKIEQGMMPKPFCAFSAMAPPGADDLVTSLTFALYIEQAQQAALSKLTPLIYGTALEKPIEWIILNDMRHLRRLAEALRITLFRYGMCDPFLPCEEPFTDAQPLSLNGRAEDIEYYLNPKTGRYACRSAKKTGVH